MKPILLAIVLTIGFCPQHAQVNAQLPQEPASPFTIITPLATLNQLSTVSVQPLDLTGFHFDPIGTHASNYPAGQCTYGVASMKGNIPDWGNANAWADEARAAGYTVSSAPIVGAVAQTDRGEFGHVAVVTAVYPDHIQIEEMNYDYNGSVRVRDAAPSEFVYIYL